MRGGQQIGVEDECKPRITGGSLRVIKSSRRHKTFQFFEPVEHHIDLTYGRSIQATDQTNRWLSDVTS